MKTFQKTNFKILYSLFLIILSHVCSAQISEGLQNIVNIPEAKGINMSIFVPNEWNLLPQSQFDNIQLSDINESQVLLISIQNSPTFYSRKSSKNIFEEEWFVKDYMKVLKERYGDAELVKHRVTAINTYPAFYLDWKMKVQTLSKSYMQDLTFVIVYYEDYIVSLGFEELTPMIKMILETIQFQNEYK